jgi:flagellar biosynthesis protein FlhB
VVMLDAKANEAGNWQAVYKNNIPSGSYEVWAKQILESGAESLASNSVYIRVNSIFLIVFDWVTNIGGALIVVLIFIVGLLVSVYYFWHKLKMLREKMRKEARQAREALESGLKHVRKEAHRDLAGKKIEQELEAIEEVVKKEIKDIEKL